LKSNGTGSINILFDWSSLPRTPERIPPGSLGALQSRLSSLGNKKSQRARSGE